LALNIIAYFMAAAHVASILLFLAGTVDIVSGKLCAQMLCVWFKIIFVQLNCNGFSEL